MVTSLGWILLSGDTYKSVYGWIRSSRRCPSASRHRTIPLGFVVLVMVSLMTKTAASSQQLAASSPLSASSF